MISLDAILDVSRKKKCDYLFISPTPSGSSTAGPNLNTFQEFPPEFGCDSVI